MKVMSGVENLCLAWTGCLTYAVARQAEGCLPAHYKGDMSFLTSQLHKAGLDSTTAMHCVEILRELAAGGRSIITTIHQPSSRLYQSLDKLLLLSQV